MMIGTRRVSALLRSCRHTSMPDISGSIQSSRMRSGTSSAAATSASSPSPAAFTRKPELSRLYRHMVPRASWSSTIKPRGLTPLFLFLSPPAVSVGDFLRDDHLAPRQVVLRAAPADSLSVQPVMRLFRYVGGLVTVASDVLGSET